MYVLFPSENSETLKKQKVVIKEGGKYRVQVFFHVQREIVAGLKYIQKLYKMSVPGMYACKSDDIANKEEDDGYDDGTILIDIIWYQYGRKNYD